LHGRPLALAALLTIEGEQHGHWFGARALDEFDGLRHRR
jgi:hypothetical protein